MSNHQVNLNNIDRVEQLSYEPVCNNYKRVQIANAIITYSIFAAMGLFLLLADSPWWCIAAEILIVGCCIVNLIILRDAYRYKGYAMREHDISYRSGVIFPKITTIPLSRVQQVSVRQGPVSRYFGLSTVNIVNGAQGLSSLDIPGLHKEDAEKIKTFITGKLNKGND